MISEFFSVLLTLRLRVFAFVLMLLSLSAPAEISSTILPCFLLAYSSEFLSFMSISFIWLICLQLALVCISDWPFTHSMQTKTSWRQIRLKWIMLGHVPGYISHSELNFIFRRVSFFAFVCKKKKKKSVKNLLLWMQYNDNFLFNWIEIIIIWSSLIKFSLKISCIALNWPFLHLFKTP